MEGDKIKSNDSRQSVYLDALTIHAVVMLLVRRPAARVYLIGTRGRQHARRCRILRAAGITVQECEFFLGTMSKDGESLFHVANRLARITAADAAEDIVSRVPELRALDEESGRKTIALYAAKVIRQRMRAQILSALVARELAAGSDAAIWLEQPEWYDSRWLRDLFPEIALRFYRAPRISVQALFPSIRSWALRHTRRKSPPGYVVPSAQQRNGNSVLMLQEDTIRTDHSLRGQPHWIDTKKTAPQYNSYILRLDRVSSIEADAESLARSGVVPLASSCLSIAADEVRGRPELAKIRSRQKRLLRAFRAEKRGPEARMLLKVAALLHDAELIGSLCLWLNARCFLVRETYYPLADAMQLVAKDVGVTVIAYQYSNLGNVSGSLLTTADTLVTFSPLYEAVFEAGEIRPGRFLSAGYLYNGVGKIVADRARTHRDELAKQGAEFILCYFDESIQNDKWALVDGKAHLAELHELAGAILEDERLGLVVKSQFMMNSPSQVYPDDELLKRAKSTGRYLELKQGTHRNDVYPTEAALTSDLCIAHKFGATAALESAVAGVRTVMLDSYGTRTKWDAIYARADIEYESMTDVITAVREHRAGNPARAALGDWSGIIAEFDPFRDGSAAERLRAVVESAVSPAAPTRTIAGHVA